MRTVRFSRREQNADLFSIPFWVCECGWAVDTDWIRCNRCRRMRPVNPYKSIQVVFTLTGYFTIAACDLPNVPEAEIDANRDKLGLFIAGCPIVEGLFHAND